MILTKIYDLELGTLFLINNYVHVNVKIFSYFYHIFKKAKCPNFKKSKSSEFKEFSLFKTEIRVILKLKFSICSI